MGYIGKLPVQPASCAQTPDQLEGCTAGTLASTHAAAAIMAHACARAGIGDPHWAPGRRAREEVVRPAASCSQPSVPAAAWQATRATRSSCHELLGSPAGGLDRRASAAGPGRGPGARGPSHAFNTRVLFLQQRSRVLEYSSIYISSTRVPWYPRTRV